MGFTGWIDGAAGEINIVPGAASDAAEFDEVVTTLNAIANSRAVEKWTCEWYGYKFQLAYTYYVYATAEGGPQDSRKKDAARRLLDVIVQELGVTFNGVEESCSEAESDLKNIYGDNILRRRFSWLWGKVK